MSIPAAQAAVLDFFESYSNFAIIGHEEPDGDCLGSQLALATYLRRKGKTATCYTPGPFVRPEVMWLEENFEIEAVRAAEAAIVVDCSTLERIGHYAETIAEIPTAVIDHHGSGESFGDTRYIKPSAPSVTAMILELIELAGDSPDATEASLLFFGLCTDTGFFRHLDSSSADVFAAASRLTEAGASPKATFAQMYGNRTMSSRRLLGRLMDRAVSYYDGRLLVTWESDAELKEFGKLARDSDTLYQQLLGIRGCEAVVLVRQEDKESCSVGLRSLDRIDVGAVAQKFGGGGHARAAGFSSTTSVDTLVQEMIEYFRQFY